MKISAIISAIEAFAPLSYQEKWDNSGLQLGQPLADCTGVLVCLDVTPAVVEEAISCGCNLIVSHHPLFFKPVKRLTASTAAGAAAMNAIAAGITIYSSHTAADSAPGGVSYALANKLGVNPKRVLSPLEGRLVRLQAIVPKSHAEVVRLALFDAGCGAIGNYDCCSFNTQGEGTFRPLGGAEPFVGEVGELHQEDEVEVSVVLPADLMAKAEAALIDVHPYETPAYAFTPMLNTLRDCGLGVYGITEAGLTPAQFVELVKERLGCKGLRTTPVDPNSEAIIRRVAVCGGSGGEFIGTAMAMGAQAYVTADVRYHDFLEHRDDLLIIDAGHYETEWPIVDVFAQLIEHKCPGTKVVRCSTSTSPIEYW